MTQTPHSDDHLFEYLSHMMNKFDESEIVTTESDNKFIHKIAENNLGYLHVLYGGSSSSSLNSLRNFYIHRDYLEFMRSYSGASLFDNTFQIFGLRDNLKRSILLNDQNAISLKNRSGINVKSYLDVVDDFWLKVSCVSFFEKSYFIELSKDGDIRLVSESVFTEKFYSFSQWFKFICQFIDSSSYTNGCDISKGEALELEFESIVFNA